MKDLEKRYEELSKSLTALQEEIFPRVLEIASAMNADIPDRPWQLRYIGRDNAYYEWTETQNSRPETIELYIPVRYIENDNWRELLVRDNEAENKRQRELWKKREEQKVLKEQAAALAKIAQDKAERDRLLALYPLDRN